MLLFRRKFCDLKNPVYLSSVSKFNYSVEKCDFKNECSFGSVGLATFFKMSKND
jgi:hypothetical protein